MCRPPRIPPYAWADENTSPTRKRGVGIIPRLRVGLVLTPLIQLLAAISSGHPMPLHSSTPILPYSNPPLLQSSGERRHDGTCRIGRLSLSNVRLDPAVVDLDRT